MQTSRASAAPREQAARVPKIGRQAAHSADTRALPDTRTPPDTRALRTATLRTATLRRKQIPADKQKMNQAQSLAVLRPIHI